MGRRARFWALLWAGWACAGFASGAEVREWNKAAMPSLVFETQEGGKVDLNAAPGKVLVLNFWAAWCVPCREELPVLQKFADSMKGKQVEVVLINIGDSSNVMDKFLRMFPVNLRNLRDRDSNAISGDWNFRHLPATVVLDKKGQARWTVIGKVDDRAEPVRSRVNLLLQEPR